jgi:hydrogenase assembly chaperone HypC/HupF
MCMGIVGRVVGMLDASQHIADVEVAGSRRRVNAALLDVDGGLAPGTYVLINMGMAIEVLEERDALEHLQWLRQLEEA